MTDQVVSGRVAGWLWLLLHWRRRHVLSLQGGATFAVVTCQQCGERWRWPR